jgi:hypothetical protein
MDSFNLLTRVAILEWQGVKDVERTEWRIYPTKICIWDLKER